MKTLEIREGEKRRSDGENGRRERKSVSWEGERWQSPRCQFLPSFLSLKAEEKGENEECFKWILKVTEGTAGHICVGYLIWRDSHLQPHLSSNLHDSHWQLLRFLVKSLGNSMHMQMCRQISSQTGWGKIDFPCLVFKRWRGTSCCYHHCFKSQIRLGRSNFFQNQASTLWPPAFPQKFTGREINHIEGWC